MNDEVDNPYRPPASSLEAFKDGHGGIWRRKRLLVMGEGAILPQRCYRCADTPTVATRSLRARWTHPLVVFAVVAMIFVPEVGWMLFLGGVIFLAVMGIRKHTQIEYALCARHHRLRKTIAAIAITMMGLSLLLSFAVIQGWGATLDALTKEGLLILAAVMLLVGALIGVIGRSLRRPVVRRYTGDLIWMAGFGRPFLELFKEYREGGR